MKTLTRTRAAPATFLDEGRAVPHEIIAKGEPLAATPAVSVVVPTYNRADMVGEAVEALLRQDTPAGTYEIIVVDNGSTDSTRRVLRTKVEHTGVRFVAVSVAQNVGPAVARNVGVALSAGSLVAFTDDDCVPSEGWLRSFLIGMPEGVGVAQGRTKAHPEQSQPLFNHFIETNRLDGSFSTSNVCYRREALEAAGGFDPSCDYWEDVDLGWRVRRSGWDASFVPDALVYHQVIKVTSVEWLLQARRFGNWPAKAARYPEFRRHLFLRLWSDPWHPLFQAFAAGLVLAPWRREFLLLALPYLATFPFRGRLTGRQPLLRAAAHMARDVVSFSALVAGSIRYRSPVF